MQTDILTVLSLATEDTSLSPTSRTHKEYMGACPLCGGRDRFHVQPDREAASFKGLGAWMCRQCRPAEHYGWGDIVAYLNEVRGFPMREALAMVKDITVNGLSQPIKSYTPEAVPDADWSTSHLAFIKRAWDVLGYVMPYLESRGITYDTAYAYRLGYAIACNPRTGEQVPSLVIPWFYERSLVRITLRDLRPETPLRYWNIAGSSLSFLYNVNRMDATKPVFLVEGELDAITINQEAGDIVTALATGSTEGGRSRLMQDRLLNHPSVYLAFDRETKGQRASRDWQTLLPHAARWMPLCKDANDMHTQGYSVRAWVEGAVLPEGEETPIVEGKQVAEARLLTRLKEALGGHVTVTQQSPGYSLTEHCKRLYPLQLTNYDCAYNHKCAHSSPSANKTGPVTRVRCTHNNTHWGKRDKGWDDMSQAWKQEHFDDPHNAFCEAHQWAYRFLLWGRENRWPLLHLWRDTDQRFRSTSYVTIGAGRTAWEAYAMIADEQKVRRLLERERGTVLNGRK